jgi:hypothetical protein
MNRRIMASLVTNKSLMNRKLIKAKAVKNQQLSEVWRTVSDLINVLSAYLFLAYF